ncbi:MAG: hypothetical protein LBK06_09160, partial [Planctomycetaceae bacterium]|nr:hypothetical protein [Planctomycetaceae bacterium]
LCAAFKLELREYIPDKVKLIYDHPLTVKPLKFNAYVIDLDDDTNTKKDCVQEIKISNKMLVIKVKSGVDIKKSFARNFKKHNLVEYKNPNVPVSIFDYHKTLGYGLMYSVTERKINVTTTTLITKNNRNLIDELQRSPFGIKLESPGIYIVEKSEIKSQIIVLDELPEDENLWITSLRNDLNAAQLKRVHVETAPYKNDPLITKYLDVIIKANFETRQ